MQLTFACMASSALLISSGALSRGTKELRVFSTIASTYNKDDHHRSNTTRTSAEQTWSQFIHLFVSYLSELVLGRSGLLPWDGKWQQGLQIWASTEFLWPCSRGTAETGTTRRREFPTQWLITFCTRVKGRMMTSLQINTESTHFPTFRHPVQPVCQLLLRSPKPGTACSLCARRRLPGWRSPW